MWGKWSYTLIIHYSQVHSDPEWVCLFRQRLREGNSDFKPLAALQLCLFRQRLGPPPITVVGGRKGIRPLKLLPKPNMIVRENTSSETARVYPLSDAQRPRLPPARSEQGLPRQGRERPRRLVQNLSRNPKCGEFDGKGSGVGRFNGEKRSGSTVRAGNKMEGEQVEGNW